MLVHLPVYFDPLLVLDNEVDVLDSRGVEAMLLVVQMLFVLETMPQVLFGLPLYDEVQDDLVGIICFDYSLLIIINLI